VIRRIGPAKTAYSSVAVPIIAMGFSTWLEDYRWTPLAVAGAVLALGGMAAALSRNRSRISAPDAA
jgi:drug/metabolite transporter (DMT)-like permease